MKTYYWMPNSNRNDFIVPPRNQPVLPWKIVQQNKGKEANLEANRLCKNTGGMHVGRNMTMHSGLPAILEDAAILQYNSSALEAENWRYTTVVRGRYLSWRRLFKAALFMVYFVFYPGDFFSVAFFNFGFIPDSGGSPPMLQNFTYCSQKASQQAVTTLAPNAVQAALYAVEIHSSGCFLTQKRAGTDYLMNRATSE